MLEWIDWRRESGIVGGVVCRLVAKCRGGRWRCRYDGINWGDLTRCFSSWVIQLMAC